MTKLLMHFATIHLIQLSRSAPGDRSLYLVNKRLDAAIRRAAFSHGRACLRLQPRRPDRHRFCLRPAHHLLDAPAQRIAPARGCTPGARRPGSVDPAGGTTWGRPRNGTAVEVFF
jgi:DNA-binding transcriptional LysR family regulator